MAHVGDRFDFPVSTPIGVVELAGKPMPDSGQFRFRVRHPDGVTFHLTHAGPKGAWEGSHFHKGLYETYTVINGCMALAFQDPYDDDSACQIKLFEPGESVTTIREETHNVYLYANTVIAVVGYGTAIGNPDRNNNDWWPASADFEQLTRGFSEADILRIARG